MAGRNIRSRGKGNLIIACAALTFLWAGLVRGISFVVLEVTKLLLLLVAGTVLLKTSLVPKQDSAV